MIAEIGHIALILATLAAILQSTAAALTANRADPQLAAASIAATRCSALFCLVAFAALITVFVNSDVSVVNVALNSHATMPLFYRISGAWGNHEGSMVLWVAILTLYGAGLSFDKRPTPSFHSNMIMLHGIIATAFLLFLVITSNPFLRLDPAPLEGQGLNPILQHPALAIHPPLLYLGYIGFVTAFVAAIAALIQGRMETAWAYWMRPWILLAWIFLTCGIVLGSWWAYLELGWGGFWFWDPVENISLMPWLTGTALIHSAILVEKRRAFRLWTLFLAIFTFTLALLGSFLVRSGILTSVHSFAVDPSRGLVLLLLLLVIAGGALILFALRAKHFTDSVKITPLSREGFLAANNFLLVSGCAAIVIGTLYPLILEALGGTRISVGAPYFNTIIGPLTLPLLLALPIAPLLAWKSARPNTVIRMLRLAAAIILAATLMLSILAPWRGIIALLVLALALYTVIGSAIGLWTRLRPNPAPWSQIIARARNLPAENWGVFIAHGGLGITLIGMVATGAYQTESITRLGIGEKTQIAGFTLRLDAVERIRSPHFMAEQASLSVFRNNSLIVVATPSKRFYPVQQTLTTEAQTISFVAGDLYIALGERGPQQRWIIRIYINPLSSWIWIGAILTVFGGVCALIGQLRRIRSIRRSTAVKKNTPHDISDPAIIGDAKS